MFLSKKKSALYVLKSSKIDLLVLTVIAVVLSVFDNFLPNDQAFPLSVPSLMGTALSLILAFRTSQAYDRWWEARKIWGAIVNDSRSIVRAANGFATDKNGGSDVKEFVDKLAFRQMAWTYSMGQKLRNQDQLAGLNKFLTADELTRIKNKVNVPNALLELQTEDIKKARANNLITEFGQLRLDEIVMRLVDSMGMCERIKNTIFPAPYNRFVHITIYIFAITLVIGIEDFKGIIEIPATIIITALFLLLERVAVLLQDPWENEPSDVPVTALANTIEIDLRQMIGNTVLPEKQEPNGYYLM